MGIHRSDFITNNAFFFLLQRQRNQTSKHHIPFWSRFRFKAFDRWPRSWALWTASLGTCHSLTSTCLSDLNNIIFFGFLFLTSLYCSAHDLVFFSSTHFVSSALETKRVLLYVFALCTVLEIKWKATSVHKTCVPTTQIPFANGRHGFVESIEKYSHEGSTIHLQLFCCIWINGFDSKKNPMFWTFPETPYCPIYCVYCSYIGFFNVTIYLPPLSSK